VISHVSTSKQAHIKGVTGDALKEVKRQRQRTAAGKKPQLAITRDEEAREAIKKRLEKQLNVRPAREELAREKVTRQTEKETKYKRNAKQSFAKLKLKRSV
jgi:hypothetical protein